jgi:aminopeptidase
MADAYLDQLAEMLVHYSLAVQRGQIVSITGPPVAEPLLAAVYRQVLGVGGHPLLIMVSEACQEVLYREGSRDQMAFVNPLEQREIEIVDAAVHVLASHQERWLADINTERPAFLRHARRPLVDRFLKRAASGELRWVATLYPCATAAQEAAMPVQDYQALILRGCFLDQRRPLDAWHLQSMRQARLMAALRETRELRLVTTAGTDLRLQITGRHWVNGDGHTNLPDGEIFTGPVEDATQGVLCCTGPIFYAGREIRGIRLVFADGRVVQARADCGQDLLETILHQDPGASILGEVGLGCNHAIDRLTGQPLLDEKMGGTFHVALGRAYAETGARNPSALHWDLLGDLRQGGRVEADGQVVSESGKFVAIW